MKTKALLPALLFVLPSLTIAQEAIPTIFQKAEAVNPTNPNYRFLWRTVPGVRYHLQTSENLSTWTDVPGYPKRAEGPVEFHDLTLVPDGKQFVKAILIDEQAPVLVESYPQDGAIGVPRFEDFEIRLRDATGIDPTSVSLTIGTQSVKTLANTPGLTLADGVLRYDAVDTAHGVAGVGVNVLLAVADTVGNATTFSWNFTLQEQATERVAGIFVFGSVAAQRDGQRLSSREQTMARSILGPVRLPADAGDTYQLNAITPTTLVISYTGAAGPALGTYVANHAPTRREEVFYRRVLSRVDDTSTKTLTLQTEDVPLPDLVDGSVAASSASKTFNVDEAGFLQPALELSAGVTFPTLGIPTGFLVGNTYDFKNQDDFTVATVTCKELKCQSTPSIEAGIQTRFGKLQEMHATIKARHDFAAVFEVEALLAASRVTRTLWDMEPEPHKFMYLGQIGVLPVYVDVVFDCEINFTTEASAALSAEFGFRRSFDQGVTLSYQDGGAVSLTPFTKPVLNETVPFQLNLTGSLESAFNIEPKLEVLVYGLAGVSGAIDAWAGVKFSRSTGGQPLVATYGGGGDLVVEPVGVVFELLDQSLRPSRTLPLWRWERNMLDDATRLAASIFPETGTDAWALERVMDNSAASDLGQTHFTYNGNPIPGATGPVYSIPASAYAGTFGAVAASLSSPGQLISSLPVAPPPPPAPPGFSLIPGGEFTMGRTSGDTDSNAPPVTVTVSAFYMAKYEVTKTLWNDVLSWGNNNGYSDLRVGGGKASGHPVHTISWFDIVKWCNARSQKEGLTPVYTVGGAVMKSGTTVPAADWSANGYRLPTEAEWEKAARGGVAGQRFPWGDTISHNEANYHSSTSHVYDVSATLGYHPAFYAGSTPYSSLVGSFAPNRYGLYDMAGNMREWCWDWYGQLTYVDGANNPRGAASGTNRVIRGGRWDTDAFNCRTAFRLSTAPSQASYGLGFRVARSLIP